LPVELFLEGLTEPKLRGGACEVIFVHCHLGQVSLCWLELFQDTRDLRVSTAELFVAVLNIGFDLAAMESAG